MTPNPKTPDGSVRCCDNGDMGEIHDCLTGRKTSCCRNCYFILKDRFSRREQKSGCINPDCDCHLEGHAYCLNRGFTVCEHIRNQIVDVNKMVEAAKKEGAAQERRAILKLLPKSMTADQANYREKIHDRVTHRDKGEA